MEVSFYRPEEPGLTELVHGIFQTDGFPDFSQETILPKGFTEIIFDLSETGSIMAHMGQQQPETLPRCFIYSFSKNPVYVQLPHQQTYFGILLHPAGIRHLLGVPAGEFANRWIDLTLVDPSFHSLWQQLAEKVTFSARIAVIKKWMQQRMKPLRAQEQMMSNFLANPFLCAASVPEVASALCYSPRQLSRKFYDITGMNTEEVLLYKKYLHALHLIHHSTLSLAAIAYESHFTDQSHFIKSFRSFTNLTPGEYRQLKNGPQPGHIFQNVR